MIPAVSGWSTGLIWIAPYKEGMPNLLSKKTGFDKKEGGYFD